MSTFNVKNLAGDRALVTGRDDLNENRKVILSTLEYNQRKQANKVSSAQEDFDRAVEEFYAPIVEAAEALNHKVEPVRDPAFFEVVQEAQPGAAAQCEKVIKLSLDTVILNLIDAGQTDRLIWVGDTIEVLEYEQPETIVVPELEDEEGDDTVDSSDSAE